MKTIGEPCVLEDRSCTECGECNLCDLDYTKSCDNCCQCIKTIEGDYAEIQIDDILLSTDVLKKGHQKSANKTYQIKQKK